MQEALRFVGSTGSMVLRVDEHGDRRDFTSYGTQ
jgi:hypothetical protein